MKLCKCGALTQGGESCRCWSIEYGSEPCDYDPVIEEKKKTCKHYYVYQGAINNQQEFYCYDCTSRIIRGTNSNEFDE
jgi:hypothetical protein